jgi:ligand-binding sensor protein
VIESNAVPFCSYLRKTNQKLEEPCANCNKHWAIIAEKNPNDSAD